MQIFCVVLTVANTGIATLIPTQGSKHTGIPFLYHEVYECGNKAQRYVIDIPGHDITLRIPNEAVFEEQTVYFEVGVAMNGPFNFPENIYPISPILWLNLIDKNASMEKSIQIFLPHCLAENLMSNKQVCFFRSSIEEADANGLYGNFTLCESGTELHEKFGVIESSCYTGIFFIAQVKHSTSDGTESDIEYCLAQVNLLPSSSLHEFHFYVMYNLATHMRVS